MKEQEKQINEMAKDIGIAFQLADTTSFVKVAEILVKKYQPKLSEDSVVLTREEYEMLIACSSYEGVMKALKNEYEKAYKQGCKDSAQKIFNKWIELVKSDNYNTKPLYDYIKQLAE